MESLEVVVEPVTAVAPSTTFVAEHSLLPDVWRHLGSALPDSGRHQGQKADTLRSLSESG